MDDTETLHWPDIGDPVVLATIEGSLDVAFMDRKLFGSESAVAAVLRAESVLEKLEMVVDAD
jgi:hypothetical protein